MRLFVLLIVLVPTPAVAQTMPVPDVHPQTGEQGTWIPEWLMKEHLIDAARLEASTKQVVLLEEQVREGQLEIEDLRTALEQEKQATDKLETAIDAAVKRADDEEEKAEILQVWAVGATCLSIGFVVTLLGLLV